MSDWRERMKQLFARASPKNRAPTLGMDEARQRLQAFIGETVVPAFEELSEELKTHGREAVIDREPFQAVLTVYREGQEEFSYAVRGRAYHKLGFAFPEHGDDKEPRICKAEVIHSSGHGPEHELGHFSREEIIRDFLGEYEKWMGW